MYLCECTWELDLVPQQVQMALIKTHSLRRKLVFGDLWRFVMHRSHQIEIKLHYRSHSEIATEKLLRALDLILALCVTAAQSACFL